MIPKIIHYCWFGRNEKPKLAVKCIKSWEKHCPDYTIKEWNEDTFDIDAYPYARYCYLSKKWAFLSDFVRLVVVEKEGGLYFDTDVELLKNPDELLQYDAFYGFENDKTVASGLGFGAVPGHVTVQKMKEIYLNMIPDEEGKYPVVSCPALNTEALLDLGLKQNGCYQVIHGAAIFPVDYLNPLNDQTGEIKKTQNTISIHWYSKSWISRGARIRSRITRPFHRIFGVDCFRWIKKIIK